MNNANGFNSRSKKPAHPNLQVLVFNKGPIQPTLSFDGQDYPYPVGKAVTVPAEVAYFHFAADYRSGRLVRQKEPEKDGSQSWYQDRLSSYQPMYLVYADRQDKAEHAKSMAELKAWHDWFDKGLIFEATGTTGELTEEEFLALRRQKKTN